ncbi:MAG: hypothetical protein ACOCWH_01560 [Spirochaetota bacterium]
MKLTPQMRKAMENMQAGRIIKTGFFGEDPRPLPDIIAHDEELCSAIGLDIDAAAARMKHLTFEGEKGLGEPITVEKKWRVTISEARGRIPSPFEDGLFKKRNTHVVNLENSEEMDYSDLSLFLIEKYHFFQGYGSPYRIEPQKMKKILEL